MIEVDVRKQLREGRGRFTIDVNFEIQPHSISAIYGPSGAGKSSLLRMLAGLLRPDDGSIRFRGDTWFDTSQKIHRPPGRRKVAMVFQEDSLFPNMTVRENLRIAQFSGSKPEIVDKLLNDFHLQDLGSRKPSHLSGGQKQRASLARAVAQEAELLLLDEPLNALDHKTRLEIQELLKQVHKQYKQTTLLVSHDLQEVFRLAEQVILMEDGKILTTGSPETVLLDLSSPNKARFEGIFLGSEMVSTLKAKVLLQDQVLYLETSPESLQDLSRGQRIPIIIDPQTGKLRLE